jgi:hypothetical protein
MFFAKSDWYNAKQFRTRLTVLLGLRSWTKARARPVNFMLPVSLHNYALNLEDTGTTLTFALGPHGTGDSHLREYHITVLCVHYSAQHSPTLDTIMSYMKPVHTFTARTKIHFNIISKPMPTCSLQIFPTNILHIFLTVSIRTKSSA